MKHLFNFLKWWYWTGRYTPVKIFEVETIGVDQGYFQCRREHNDVRLQHYKDVKTIGVAKANALLQERSEAVIRKYFGPKYVPAGRTRSNFK